ncbi:hypothetical protein TB2_030455 [Malus domestica]
MSLNEYRPPNLVLLRSLSSTVSALLLESWPPPAGSPLRSSGACRPDRRHRRSGTRTLTSRTGLPRRRSSSTDVTSSTGWLSWRPLRVISLGMRSSIATSKPWLPLSEVRKKQE